MAALSIVVGILLTALGLGGYFYTEREHNSALIPVGLGAALVVLGVLALREQWRKHSMHAAMLFALVGLGGSAWRAIPGIIKHASGEELTYPAAPYINLAIALCCAVFLGLGIKSYVDARRRRQPAPE